jgi:protein-S-isoprenylcysteine O-methyltransferase Ste14
LNKARYLLAVITLVSMPPAILLWFLIHPFGGFWRRLGPWISYLALGVVTLLLMWGVFHQRQRLLAVDFGTSSTTVVLAMLFLGGGLVIALKRKRYLTLAILSGLPQLSKEHYPGVLLREGIYSRIRHPRYVEVTLWVLGYAFFANFLATYVVAALTFPVLFLIVILEERELSHRFGQEWEEYARQVPRFIPRRRRSVPP